jgi:polyprenyl-phospho-N-acetylgalactosaminyl synthase
MTAFRPCAVIPTYDNPETIAKVVRAVRQHLGDVIVVDDASHEPAASRISELQASGVARVVRRAANGGKGAAVKTGLAEAHACGFTHAVQVDADGQHAIEDIPRFVAAAAERPAALVLGQPVFDASVPKARLYGRKISVFWAWIETFGDVVGDPLCGFRVYPVSSALAARARGDRMDFDPEIAVRLAWMGVPVVRLPTRVRYVPAAEGGVSHFQGLRDNLRISWIHTRLVIEACFRWLFRRTAVLPPVRDDGAAR